MMIDKKLIVFEGPDNVGKTTICNALSESLKKLNYDNIVLSFPGNVDGTLGNFIHDLHHNHNKYGVHDINNISLQLLHVAAHFDTIEKTILPALEASKIVILDRFWWSTFIYGSVSGIDISILQEIIRLESYAWQKIVPDLVIFFDNPKPYNITPNKNWFRLHNEYCELFAEQSKNLNGIKYTNSVIHDTVSDIIKLITTSN